MIIELHHCFTHLTQLLSELQTTLLEQKPTHWLPLTSQEEAYSDSLNVLTGLLGDLWYQGNQDGRATRARHGIVLANEEVIALVKLINQQKDHFKEAVKTARSELTQPQWLEEYGKLGQSNLRDALHYSDLTRVHLRQCYRHIPLLDERPTQIGFSWYVSGRSIRKLSIADAEQALLALGEEKPHIRIQLQKLGELPVHTELAQMQTLAPVVRANIRFKHSRKAMNTSLPLFVPDLGNGLPSFNKIELTPPETRTRKIRADSKVDPDPFLPSIRAHLYQ